MSAWWLLLAFALGWAMCWKFSKFIARTVLRNGGEIMEEALTGLRQDALLKVHATVERELAKRRGDANQDRDPAKRSQASNLEGGK